MQKEADSKKAELFCCAINESNKEGEEEEEEVKVIEKQTKQTSLSCR
jgi:hypothetical protein